VIHQMKLTARKDETLDDDYIDIQYRELTPAISEIFKICNEAGLVLLCEKDGATHNVDINDVLYIEWVDNKSCVYTKDEVFIMHTPLSRLEESLKDRHFVRTGKISLINIYKIKSVSNGLYYRLTAEMVNGENVVISRRYRGALLEAIHNLAKEVSE
jgi:DNA-binding LytR/AlgR family response regulator